MASRFWRQARSDLLNAYRLLVPEGYYGAVFFAHQAAEKVLKGAYWEIRREEPPWKHDLIRCLGGIEMSGVAIPSGIKVAVEKLQPMFEATRYPSGDMDEPIPADAVLDSDARLAIRLAEEVITWVRELVEQPPSEA